MPTYYPINEETARASHDMMSFSDYRAGSKTAEYRQMVDEATAIAEAQKARGDPMYHEKIDRLLESYTRRLAENFNAGSRIGTMCPSVMISGGGNFPVMKKEKQNAAFDRNMTEYQEIQGIIDKIRSVGTGGISSDDPNAIEKLKLKLEGLEADQEYMKIVNAYYRKHKTLEGYTGMSDDTRRKLEAGMVCWNGKKFPPYQSWALSNNNANMKRIRERIAALEKRREVAPTLEGWEFDGGRVEMNADENRVQIFYDEKPDAELRAELKHQGFRWAPSQGAWQRQLNANGIRAAKAVTGRG